MYINFTRLALGRAHPITNIDIYVYLTDWLWNIYVCWYVFIICFTRLVLRLINTSIHIHIHLYTSQDWLLNIYIYLHLYLYTSLDWLWDVYTYIYIHNYIYAHFTKLAQVGVYTF